MAITYAYQYAFIRKEGLSEIDQLAVLGMESSLGSHGETFEAFKAAVTKWVKETPAGQKEWKDACGDLNIGDLVSHLGDNDLLGFLSEEGVEAVDVVYQLGSGEEIAYDHVLADPDDPEDEAP
jgi:hypothetical protein